MECIKTSIKENTPHLRGIFILPTCYTTGTIHMPKKFPTIKSKRLFLVPIAMRHKNQIFKEFTSEVTKYMFPLPAKKVADSEKFIRSSRRNMARGEELVLAVVNKRTKSFMGCAGLHKMNTKHPEFGIWIKKSAQGHGYGREALAALKEWADENVRYEYIYYPVAKANYASRKIPESLGGKRIREFDGKKQSGEKMREVEYRIYPK